MREWGLLGGVMVTIGLGLWVWLAWETPVPDPVRYGVVTFERHLHPSDADADGAGRAAVERALDAAQEVEVQRVPGSERDAEVVVTHDRRVVVRWAKPTPTYFSSP